MTQSQIFEMMQEMIPEDLWEKHSHLSFAEMADVPALAEFSAYLRQADTDWFSADDA